MHISDKCDVTVAERSKAQMSPPAQTLGLYVRIPLEAWISPHFICVCVVACRSPPCGGLIPGPNVLPIGYSDSSTLIVMGTRQRANPSRKKEKVMLNYNHAIKTYGGVKVQPLAPER